MIINSYYEVFLNRPTPFMEVLCGCEHTYKHTGGNVYYVDFEE